MALFSIDDAIRSYSGRPGCACGCRGKYSYDQRTVHMAAKRMLAEPNAVRDGNVVSIETDSRLRIVYLRDGAS